MRLRTAASDSSGCVRHRRRQLDCRGSAMIIEGRRLAQLVRSQAAGGLRRLLHRHLDGVSGGST